MYISKFVYVHTHDAENNIIINGITGAIDIVNSNIAEILHSKKTDSLVVVEQDVLENLLSRGYLFKNIEDEAKKIKEVYDNYLEDAKDLGYVFAFCPTYGCNLKCVYCFEGDLTAQEDVMSKEMLESSFDFIKALIQEQPGKEHSLQLFGGEPLLPSIF